MVITSILFSYISAFAYQLTPEWDPNVERDLAGYIVYYGKSTRNYKYDVIIGDRTSCTIAGLHSGVTYYFAVTAYDIDGNIAVLALAPNGYKMHPGWQALDGIGDIEEITDQIGGICNKKVMGASSWHSFDSGPVLYFYTCGQIEKVKPKSRAPEPQAPAFPCSPNIFPAVNDDGRRDHGGDMADPAAPAGAGGGGGTPGAANAGPGR